MIPQATQQQPMVAQVQPFMQQMRAPAHPMEKYKTLLFNFGITEIVLGGICCLLGAVSIIIGSMYYRFLSLTFVGQGIWCGSVLIVCGILSVMTRTRPTRCMYNANMAMSIVAANFMITLAILSGMAAALDSYSSLIIAFHSIVCIVGFAALIITIIHSAYCCAGVCCLESYPRQVVVLGPNGMMPLQLDNDHTVLYSHPAVYTAPYMVSMNPSVNMTTAGTQVSFTHSMQPNSMMPVGQPVQSASVQSPVSPNALPVYTPNSQK